MDITQRVDEKNGGHSSNYVYSQIYVYENVKKGSFYVLTAEYNKSQFRQDI